MNISKQRVEAFSDGVIAIIVTIMVLNIPLPDKFNFDSIMGLINSIIIYFVSFFVVASQWNKHRHLFDNIENIYHISIWRNFLYLFFLSLMPIFTKWVIQNPDEVVPVIGYDILFLLVNICYHFVWNSIMKENEEFKKDNEKFKNEGKASRRGFAFMLLVLIGIFVLSFFYPRISVVFFIGMPVVFSLFNLIVENPHHIAKK
jgi:uncharacterized membrane protein